MANENEGSNEMKMQIIESRPNERLVDDDFNFNMMSSVDQSCTTTFDLGNTFII